MEKINAVITGVGGYVPDYILTNDEISKMVDTNDEWIMTRIGVKERHILNEEGLGSSYMARKAAKQLMKKTGANPDDIDLLSLPLLLTITSLLQLLFFVINSD
jgi:3-oxoacyl-[acyl-carrier-protein] synthase-3